MSQDKEAQLIEKIRKGRFSERDLINLYTNATTRHATNVIEAVSTRLAAEFPRAAKRMFGAKTDHASARLEEVFNKLAAAHDLTGNRVKNGVKTGGESISGKMHIDVYISYKNGNGVGASLGLIQDTPDSELMATVKHYKTGKQRFGDVQKFQMDDFDAALDAYQRWLSEVLADGSFPASAANSVGKAPGERS